MEQERDGREGGGDTNKHQPQDQAQAQAQAQAQQPHKCPRCESLNTKFCYYNNYSLSQPRYFCKTCRRYWTQGGTLRNVPVGGGCRKGKRTKSTSSSRSTQEVVGQRPIDPSSAAGPSMTPFYGGGGYLSSLPVNPSQSHPFDAKPGDVLVSSCSSNFGVVSGFNFASLSSQLQTPPSAQFYQREVQSLYSPEQALNLIIPSSMASRSSDWSQSFVSNNGASECDGSLWSTVSTTSSITESERTNAIALISNQWPHVPGYGPPP